MKHATFATQVATLRKTFSSVPGIQGNQLKALTTLCDNYISNGTIMSEGNISAEIVEPAFEGMYVSLLNAAGAIVTNWNGKATGY